MLLQLCKYSFCHLLKASKLIFVNIRKGIRSAFTRTDRKGALVKRKVTRESGPSYCAPRILFSKLLARPRPVFVDTCADLAQFTKEESAHLHLSLSLFSSERSPFRFDRPFMIRLFARPSSSYASLSLPFSPFFADFSHSFLPRSGSVELPRNTVVAPFSLFSFSLFLFPRFFPLALLVLSPYKRRRSAHRF